MCKEKWRRGVKMKIDFYAPKKYYFTHILVLSGWVNLFVYNIFLPLGKDNCSQGMAIWYFLITLIPIDFLLLAVLILVFQIIFKSKIRNKFIVKNCLYDFIYDMGIVFVFIPIVWYYEVCKFKLVPVLCLVFLFIFIRLLKYVQRKMEKRCKNEN